MVAWKYLLAEVGVVVGGLELEEPEFGSKLCYLQAVPTLDESLKYTEPQLSHLYSGDNNSVSPRGL